jgi:hypothetical protein
VRVAAAWHERCHDPVLLTLGRRPGEADIGLGAEPLAGARLVESDQATRRDRLLLLFTLPAPFIDRLVLTAAAHAATRWTDADFRTNHGLRLGAAVAARATPALRRVAAQLTRPDEPIVVHAAPAGADEPPRLRTTRTDTGLAVTGALPLEWVSRVWGPGISEPDGHMVIARRAVVEDGRSVEVEVDVVEWHPDGPDEWEGARRPALLRRDNDDRPWRVEPLS